MTKLRIVFTGGGTGGHIFPLVAVADELLRLGQGSIELRYYGPKSEWNEALTARDIPIQHIAGSKFRRYASLHNLVDIPKFFFGLLQALFKLYFFMPDAVFSKGGPGALPVVLAAAWYHIPIVVHESDAVPGLTNRVSAALARRVCISFRSAAARFPERKVIFTGNPVRTAFAATRLEKRAAKSQLGIDGTPPLLLVLGGSQGAKILNEFVERALPMLIATAQVFHQTGKGNAATVTDHMGARTRTASRYVAREFLDERELAMALRAADLVLTRAGAGAIYECAAAGAPAILVPLAKGANDHQRLNAAEYAASGAAFSLEEDNLTPNLATGEIK
ncbi:MAG: UDP-N-acetylglucosamine--N-acetylmuramyl-(pentapeptide) pyrophosphoryl-undecaprenol N-acetylglucosamine transferase, partial [Candidatus Jorgensenbacteria bacterium]|nr:UDP-N-acetylglucosamine--N-acetylmuramyl-(pentapeptide) pyrophosphoryl-undecaprenol N-acetylglucosamine transferase [Candidatus Jorgensenbacteria bacterium]